MPLKPEQVIAAVNGDKSVKLSVRDDIGPEDLVRTLAGMCYTHDQPGWQKSVLRLVDIFIDGLRNRGAKRRTEANQKT
jgi:hypothetical protein